MESRNRRRRRWRWEEGSILEVSAFKGVEGRRQRQIPSRSFLFTPSLLTFSSSSSSSSSSDLVQFRGSNASPYSRSSLPLSLSLSLGWYFLFLSTLVYLLCPRARHKIVSLFYRGYPNSGIWSYGRSCSFPIRPNHPEKFQGWRHLWRVGSTTEGLIHSRYSPGVIRSRLAAHVLPWFPRARAGGLRG